MNQLDLITEDLRRTLISERDWLEIEINRFRRILDIDSDR